MYVKYLDRSIQLLHATLIDGNLRLSSCGVPSVRCLAQAHTIRGHLEITVAYILISAKEAATVAVGDVLD